MISLGFWQCISVPSCNFLYKDHKNMLKVCSWLFYCIWQYTNILKLCLLIKNRITIWSSNLTHGHISRQKYSSKRNMNSYINSSIIYNNWNNLWKQPKCSLTSEWIKKDMVPIVNGILLSHKKNKIMPSAVTWYN